MKKRYKSIKSLIAVLCLVTTQLSAQLGGVYTINNTQPVSSTNFTSFTQFANALSATGVTAAVTANVGGTGPYTEQPLFTAITGASSVNRVTINGNNYLLTFASNNFSLRHTMGFNGADYITVNNLRMEGTGSYQYPAHFYNGADYNSFNNCTFSVTANTQTSDHIPVVFSNSSSSYASYGLGGNYNVFTGCTMFSGYMGISIYGNTSAPYVRGNEFIQCDVRDFYVYGIYINPYTTGHKLLNNTFHCPARTNATTKYGIYTVGTADLMCDGNWIKNLFSPGLNTNGNQVYGIYIYYNLMSSYTGQQYPSQLQNIIRNNIISDIQHNGPIYGIRAEYYDGQIYNNTISLDYTGASSGTTYGIWIYGQAGYYVSHTKNNIVTITRGGSGTKWCFYNGPSTSSSELSCDRNDFYISSAGGTNYVGHYTSSSTTHSGFQAQGANTTGFSVDPAYVSLGTDYHPTNTTINNQAIPMQLVFDQQKMPRSGSTPDIGALEFLSSPCSGTPNPGSVLTPTYNLCPGESADIILSNFSSDLGLTYQWQSSTSNSVGPYTSIPSATSVLMNTGPLNVPTWYQVVVTCTNSQQQVSPIGFVNVVGTATNTVPYFEGFEGIQKTNKLPNCSWTSPQLGGTALTYTTSNNMGRVPRTGTRFASFYYTPAGTKQFYTNGIWMNAGVTYSASVWYTTEYYGYNTWSDMSLLVGPNQNSTGQQLIVSTNGPAISNVYKSLSNTFTVPTSGFYYVEIRGTSGSACCAYYLSWDDLQIIVPCELNAPTMNVSTNQATVCANQPVTIQASGADTYTWSTGDQTDIITTTPIYPGTVTYYVTGTNTLSGCPITKSQVVLVNPTPNLNVFASPPAVCAGSPANLYAFGAQNYIWTTNGTGNIVTVMPATTSTYAVVGSNQYNCSSQAVVQVNVNQLPNINATYPSSMCLGEVHAINASGGVKYEFVSGNSYNTSNPAMVSPASSTQYTVIGTDLFGCSNSTLVTIIVDECTGISENSALYGLRVYPNPTNGEFTIELKNNNEKNVEIADVTGRVVVAEKTSAHNLNLNISNLANGVYHVKVKSQDDVQVIRIIKD